MHIQSHTHTHTGTHTRSPRGGSRNEVSPLTEGAKNAPCRDPHEQWIKRRERDKTMRRKAAKKISRGRSRKSERERDSTVRPDASRAITCDDWTRSGNSAKPGIGRTLPAKNPHGERHGCHTAWGKAAVGIKGSKDGSRDIPLPPSPRDLGLKEKRRGKSGGRNDGGRGRGVCVCASISNVHERACACE